MSRDAADPGKTTLAQNEPSTEAKKSSPSTPNSLASKEQATQAPEGENVQPDSVQPDALSDGRYKFYLLRPRTSSVRRVLIPLTASDPLGDVLRGCTVEEFPTMYYFRSTTTELPAEFMLDEDYRREEGEQQREFEELMKDVDPEILKRLRDDGASGKAGEEVDSKKILDVLKQDLGRL